MELKTLIAPLWKWRWIILSATILAGVVSFIVSLGQPPQYLAKTTLIIGQSINNPNPSSNQFNLEQQLATIYADMGSRDFIRRSAMDALGLDWLPDYMVRAIPETQLIEISVTDTDRIRARAVAEEIANQLILKAPSSISSDEQERQAFLTEQLNTMQTDIENTQKEIETKKSELGTLNSASQISSTEQQIFALENKLSTLQDTYASLLVSSSKGALNSLTVIDPAESTPINSSRMITSLLSALVGFMLASSGIFLLEWLDQTLHSSEEASRILNLPLLGEIPRMPKEDNPLSFVNDQPFSPITDAFRSLRNNLEFIDLGKDVRSILVSSPGVAEGKTTVSVNLAVALAKANKRVILIDADFYQSTIREKFNLEKLTGLGDLLISGKNSISENLISLFNGQLYLLPTGKTPPNPAEMISSPNLDKILETLKSAADVVIIDGPPFITSDAIMLATKVDGVLIVLSQGKSRREVLRNAKDQLSRAKVRLLGFVMNESSKRSSYYSYYQKPNPPRNGNGNGTSKEKQITPPKRIINQSK
ncbi:MAG: hypothetical protein CVU39_17745 [Chloroflexi bacterium HGW-Chloroflexi-10]|nr:MAG: hypothetical protein CVU39_17745 [Chloroflexi bacterium HGW-Chloroflexi-10]